MLSRKFYSFSASLLALSLAAPSAEEPLLRPLDLERVVIRGEARRLPVTLKPNNDQTAQPISSAPRDASIADEESARLTFHNTFRLSGGSHNFWEAFESILLQRSRSSIGLVLQKNQEDGFRDGYGAQHQFLQTEWSQRTSKHLQLRTRYSYSDRDFELPNSINTTYNGASRDERIHDLHLQFESPWTEKKQIRLILDHTNASQINSVESDYDYQLYRAGIIYEAKPWESAISLEMDQKNGEGTSLLRLFVKRSHRVIDDKTSVHIGAGAYGLSSRESRVDPSGYFSLANEAKDLSIAFSPFLQLDHQLEKNLAFTAAYTQFYESLSFVDTYYNQPEYLRPSNLIIQPSFNVQIEGGLRWDINEIWKLSVAYEWHKYKDRPVTVAEPVTGKLTQEVWVSGQEQIWRGHLIGNIDEQWDVDLSLLRRYSEWDFFNLDFTPYQPKWEFGLRGDRHFGKWKTGLEFQYQIDRQSYPVVIDLGDRPLWNAEVEWNPWNAIFFNTRCENIFDHQSEKNIGYPDAPFRIFAGLRVRF
jgi:hypothetical protein